MTKEPAINQFTGSILGLALGDALGAPFEGHQHISSTFLDLLLSGPTDPLRYTDDTEMALGLTEALIGGFSSGALINRFVMNFDMSRGYGRGTIAILEMIKQGAPWQKTNKAVFPDGSFGNGAAMRVAPVGLLYHNNTEKLLQTAYESSIVTHSHPLAIEGATIIALSTAMALNGAEPGEILIKVISKIKEPEYMYKARIIKELLKAPPVPAVAARALGCSVKAHESVPAALFAFLLNFGNYTSAIRYAIEMGGDTDTIAAMAGAMAGAATGYQGLPEAPLEMLEGRDRLEALSVSLHEKAMKSN